jgi:excisionase family DNA binding protein
MGEEYYTPEEIATMLKVPQSTVYHWIRTGQLYADKYGRALRIPKSSLEDFRKPAVERDPQKSQVSLMP